MAFTFGLIPGIIDGDVKADFFGTMKKVAEIGYRCIEGGGKLTEGDAKAVAETKKKLDAMGLAVSGIGAGRQALETSLDPLVEKAHVLGAAYIVDYWGPCESRDVFLKDLEFFESVAARCERAGLKFCYHHHDHEFRTEFDGMRAIDLMIRNTSKLCIEVDVAWVTYGGAEPADFIRRHRGRIPAIHLKDIADLTTRGKFTAVGTGHVDIVGSVRAADECGVKFVIVEQDAPRNLSGMDSVRAAYLNVKEAGLLALA